MLDPDPTIQILRRAAQCLRSPASSVAEELTTIQHAQDALEALKIDRLAHLEESKEHEGDGASSVTTWAKARLRQDGRRTRSMVKAARTVRTLPAVGEAAVAGVLSLEHLEVFTYGLKHIGEEVMLAAEGWLLDVARTCEPSLLLAKVKELRAAVHPDELEEAWVRGMAKQDITIAQTIDGWFVTGFLGIETGAKLRTVLESLSVPRDEGDRRDAAERRVDALDEMLDAVLQNGLPADNGVRPHLNVIVESETLREALRPTTASGPAPLPGLPAMHEMATRPAHLVGFGPIGKQMLGYLTCQADLTPVLVESIEPNTAILDVGRSSRHATAKQRRAVHVRQAGRCATPACSRAIRHVHHVVWWARDEGRTDLANLAGLCGACHRLVHAEKLVITIRADGRGYDFTNARGRPIRGPDERRVAA